MVKIKKLKRKKTYKYNVNRKRMKNRMKKRPAITCEQMKGEWDSRKSVKENLRQMGLTSDVNATIKIPTDRPDELMAVESLPDPKKTHVAMELEADAKAPRQKNFCLPNSQVFWLTKLIDKYGEDYQAMSRDRKMNAFQETWKQLRQKIKTFKNIPEQWNAYLEKKEQEQETSAV
ncbi:hypothetical protein GE061_006909 [Apolygus lucorum]|uniref:Nucleolar protein 16 n=1 Tax=Apolygus lucorum TaxID=248454 RepID=A0A8S9WST3_APOLU|nr:hypothetical protein GE061_006909 [Apolygus lucorum]